MFKATTLTIALLLCFYSSAQVDPIYSNYKHYTNEDGLPQIHVTSVAQDLDGFIWVCTSNGLARFDGHEFLRFDHDSPKGQIPSTTLIKDLIVDESNNLWILHFNNKVDKMDPRTFEIEQSLEPIKDIFNETFQLTTGSKEGSMSYFVTDFFEKNWYVKSGKKFNLYDTSLVDIFRFFEAPKSFKKKVFGFDIDQDGSTWLMTTDGLAVLEKNGHVREIMIPDSLQYNPTTSSKCPVFHSEDRVIFSSLDRVFIYDIAKDQFSELRFPKVNKVRSDRFFIMKHDPQSRMIFVNQGYVFRLEPDNSITTLWEYPNRQDFLITDVLIDETNTLWVSANTDGLYKINMLTPSIHSYKYNSNFITDLLTRHMNVDTKEIPTELLKESWSYGLRYEYTGNSELIFKNAWSKPFENMFYILQNNSIKKIPFPDVRKPMLSGISHDAKHIWAVDWLGGIHKWEDLDLPAESRIFKSITNPDHDRILDLIVDEHNQWVLSGANKIYQLQNGSVVSSYPIGSNDYSTIAMSQDPTDSKILWVASLGGGLIKWSKETKSTVKSFTRKDGLCDNSIGAIVPDDFGNLWLGTFNGLAKFNIETSVFTNYSTEDGLLESEFNRHHGFKLPNGRIALGGTKGYSILDPLLFEEDNFNPEVKITRLYINNNEQSFKDSLSLIDQSLNELENLNLKYKYNSFALTMAANQFNDPSKINYRYKLHGYNNDWVFNDSDRKIKFDKLRTGNYTLSLNASNTNGRWSNEIRELNIRIHPPPWLSWWAYTLYLLVGCTLVFLYWRNYRRKLIRKQEEEFNRREAVRLKEVDDMKTRFFSNITHEFRTPLTLILSPLEKQLRDKKYPLEVQTILESNYRHGSHLLKLVNELLDISKLEGGFMQMHKSTGQLNPFLKGCVEDFSDLAQQKGIDLTFESKNISGYHQFDKNHLEKVVQNLLSNAIKFTDKGGKVGLSAEVTDDKLILEVCDSGIGIPNEQLPKLFDRFYQVDDTATRAYEGTGIGLSLVKELTGLMEGSIAVESTVGEGTIFKLSIPVSRAIVVSEPTNEKVVGESELPEGAPVILVVEDNGELRSFIVESLAKVADVIEAKDGKEGWQMILDRLPDIVVSDVMMPEMNGYELCHTSKTDTRTSHIDFIVLTAKTAQESKEKGLESGADDYLTKPFHMYELELRIQNAFQQQANLRKHLRQEFLSLKPNEETPAVKNDFLRQLYETLALNISDKNVNVEELASEMAMSQSTLNRKLKALLGLSAIEFIKQARLQRAVELLSTGQNMSEIAYQVGFDSPSYFSQCFKEAYGMRPTDYQKQLD